MVKVIRVVCGVITDESGRVLACRRSEERHLGGLWEFPGGKVEAGEGDEEALVRELKEELGVDVEARRLPCRGCPLARCECSNRARCLFLQSDLWKNCPTRTF